MDIINIVRNKIVAVLQENGMDEIQEENILLEHTKDNFEGDYTLVCFALSKILKDKPESIAHHIGGILTENAADFFSAYEVIQGFLNLSIHNDILELWLRNYAPELNVKTEKPKTIMVEYSSPNTNKPLHFGHMRNIFLGDSVSRILAQQGNTVIKANLINDRGIHICKSMLAWQKWGAGDTPEKAGEKGDHFVGNYYVLFDKQLNAELEKYLPEALAGNYKFEIPDIQSKYDALVGKYQATDAANSVDLEKEIKALLKNHLPLMNEAREMLLKWEENDADTRALWTMMNDWVYSGFAQSYDRMDIHFDKVYHESETYLRGKEMVLEGLKEGKLYQKEDQSIWVDLSEDNLDQKLLLRGDGTAVYMTQDLGTADIKYNDYKMDKSVYVIGDEQNYHMQVLKSTLHKLEEPYWEGIEHLSYGMVELPDGKMKSREGNVIDADNMMDDMVELAKEKSIEAGKTAAMGTEAGDELYSMIGLGALKFFLLKVSPVKKMLFDPKESIDLHGYTASAIQYTHARICSVFRKLDLEYTNYSLQPDMKITAGEERTLVKKISDFASTMATSAHEMDPSHLCMYLYELTKNYNSFYDACPISIAEKEEQNLRLALSKATAEVIKLGMDKLGIQVPDKM